MTSKDNNLQRFERYGIDLEKKVLWYENAPVELPIKAVELLCVLIENSGEIVSREELLDSIWRDSFVEESVLTQNVYLLRKVFKEHGIEENLIQTVARRGYRFTGEIDEIADEEIVIEKQTIERTFIGDIEHDSIADYLSRKGREPDSNKLLDVSAHPLKKRFSKPILVFVAALLGLGAVVAVFYWNYLGKNQNSGFTAENIKKVAVLPFQPINKSEQTETLSLGLTDNLIGRLGSLKIFTVSPFSAVDKFAESGVDALTFGKKLNVDGVLVGTIQEDGDRLRVNVSFIDTRSGSQIWADDFEEAQTDIFRLQDNLSKQVAKLLSVSLSSDQQTLLTQKLTDDPKAYREYLKGEYFQRMMTLESLRNAVKSYENAIELDRKFAEAYVNLANANYLIFASEYSASQEYPQKANEYLEQGLRLKPDIVTGLTLKADIAANVDWNWQLADEILAKAIAVEPSAEVYAKRGFLLLKRGKYEEAKIDLSKAKSLDPTSITTIKNLGMAHFYAKEYAESEAAFRETLQLNPSFKRANWFIIRIYIQTNRKKEAVDLLYEYIKNGDTGDLAEQFKEKSKTVAPEEMIRFYALERLTAHKKRSPEKINPIVCANLAAMAGLNQETVEWLQKAVAEKRNTATWMKIEPEFEFVRNDSRFIALLQTINLAS